MKKIQVSAEISKDMISCIPDDERKKILYSELANSLSREIVKQNYMDFEEQKTYNPEIYNDRITASIYNAE